MFPQPYFAPSYFNGYYFDPPPDPASGGVTSTYSDRDAFRAIVSALVATGEFAQVLFGTPLDAASVPLDSTPLAALLPAEWEEVEDAGAAENIRSVSYTLALSVRDADPQQRFESLDRLTAVVQDAINGSDLNGGCLPNLTTIRKGVYDRTPIPPEQRVSLAGKFAYYEILT